MDGELSRRTGAVTRAMKEFSANGSPLSPLAVRISHRAAEPVAVLDRSKVAHPATRVAESFWSVTEQLHEMLAALNFGDLDGQALARRKRSILGNMELLIDRKSTRLNSSH